MRHWSQKNFWGIFVGIKKHKKGYLIYVLSTQKMVSSHDVVFEKGFSSALAYTHSEEIAMPSSVLYITYATSYHEKTGDIITFAQF